MNIKCEICKNTFNKHSMTKVSGFYICAGCVENENYIKTLTKKEHKSEINREYYLKHKEEILKKANNRYRVKCGLPAKK